MTRHQSLPVSRARRLHASPGEASSILRASPSQMLSREHALPLTPAIGVQPASGQVTEQLAAAPEAEEVAWAPGRGPEQLTAGEGRAEEALPDGTAPSPGPWAPAAAASPDCGPAGESRRAPKPEPRPRAKCPETCLRWTPGHAHPLSYFKKTHRRAQLLLPVTRNRG